MKYDRRHFLKTVTAGAVAATAGGPVEGLPSHSPQRSSCNPVHGKSPKNVILMICDDLGYGDLGCYGSPIPTPHLDALARQGARFTHYGTVHAICSASRASLLTGRYAPRSHTVGAYFPHSPTGTDLAEMTLGNLFQDKGFRTLALGKWHLGDAPAYLPTHRGFDHFYGVPYSVDMQPLPLIRDLETLEPDTDRNLLTQRYTAEAVQFLEQADASPFFMYLGYSYPHDPVKASERFRGSTQFGDYGDAIHEIDWSVGRICETLRSTGKLDDTLILFTSDHGPWFQGDPGILRGRKGSTFEGGHRVPMIMHWPNGLAANQIRDVWATHLDIMPTLISWCGLGTPRLPLDGTDMKEAFQGCAEPAERPTVLYFNPVVSGGREIHCARKGDWKLRIAQVTGEIYILDRGIGKASSLPAPELYNVRTDVAEAYNVANSHPEIVQTIYSDIRAAVPSFPADVIEAFHQLEANRASVTTPPGAAPRPVTGQALPEWAWEPPERRSKDWHPAN